MLNCWLKINFLYVSVTLTMNISFSTFFCFLFYIFLLFFCAFPLFEILEWSWKLFKSIQVLSQRTSNKLSMFCVVFFDLWPNIEIFRYLEDIKRNLNTLLWEIIGTIWLLKLNRKQFTAFYKKCYKLFAPVNMTPQFQLLVVVFSAAWKRVHCLHFPYIFKCSYMCFIVSLSIF